jgi:hypothetical protein
VLLLEVVVAGCLGRFDRRWRGASFVMVAVMRLQCHWWSLFGGVRGRGLVCVGKD